MIAEHLALDCRHQPARGLQWLYVILVRIDITHEWASRRLFKPGKSTAADTARGEHAPNTTYTHPGLLHAPKRSR